METLVTGRVAESLRANRSAFNARFAEARRARPALDPAAFSHLLRSTVVPIAQAVERQHPDQTNAVVHALYELSLDLLGQGLLGPDSRYPLIAQGWQDLLPRLSRYVAASPRRTVGAITNALYNLCITPGARPGEWIESMAALGDRCDNETTLFQAGQIAAWRAGMAHYRQGALELCQALEPAIARAALGLPPASEPELGTLISRLSANPWLRPAQAQDKADKPGLRIIARVGAFRGFGGLFSAPPRVASVGKHFIVTDGQASWLLVADVFGATWHRSDHTFIPGQTAPFSIDRNGQVTHAGYKQSLPELAHFSSAASNGDTLAVTIALSFAVHLVALVET